MDRLKRLETFLLVADSGSFSVAAERSRQSKGSVSKQIKQLEEDLGVRLLQRTTRRVSLTDTGRAYLQRCREALGLLEEAEREAGHETAQARGQLRVNAPMSFGVRHLAPLLADYRAAHPDVAVELSLNDRRVDLVEEGYDLAIRIGVLEDSSLVARRLADCRMVVCAAPNYLARRGRPSTPDDLLEHDCLCYSYTFQGETWPLVGADGKRVAIRPRGPLIANNGDALAVAAVSGMGIVLQPSFIVAPDLRAGRLERVLPGYEVPTLQVSALYAPGRYLPLKVRSFIDFLAARFAPEAPWDAGLPT